MNLPITGDGIQRTCQPPGLARCFAASGHRLFLVDLNPDGVRDSHAQIGGAPHVAATADITIRRANQSALRHLRRRTHRDALINNSRTCSTSSPLETFPEERWDVLIDVMLKGPFLMMQAVLPRMRENNFGRIVNIGSIHSLIASPFKSAYTAAKHGLLGLSKAIALETAGAEITINTLCPAYVRTPLVDAQIGAQAKAHGLSEQEVIEKIMLEPMPKKAFITIDEIAATAEFLLSRAARNITGQTIVIDGGWTAR